MVDNCKENLLLLFHISGFNFFLQICKVLAISQRLECAILFCITNPETFQLIAIIAASLNLETGCKFSNLILTDQKQKTESK